MRSEHILLEAGVSFKAQHFSDLVSNETPCDATWFEVHPENYMVDGGLRLHQLETLRTQYPLSMHGVGLSLGGGELPDPLHLHRLKALVDRFEPTLVSEHIAWSAHNGLYLADLLPVPRTPDALDNLVRAIDKTQTYLNRQILIENPSNYLTFCDDVIPELEFITDAALRSGCRLLVDVNNIYISAHNLGFRAETYLDGIPGEFVGEIHLAGHTKDAASSESMLIDTHGCGVSESVWGLYERLVRRIGLKPTLVEWDNDIPSWSVLNDEAKRVASIHAACCSL